MSDGIIAPSQFSAQDFRRRIEAGGPLPTDRVEGDHTFNPDLRDMIMRPGLSRAAVLVPVIDHGEEAGVLLTKRADALRAHSGQIAFPGGRIDPGDVSPEAAALRETLEEVGLGERDIEVVGRMPDYFSGSGYQVTPVLGIVRPDYLVTVNADEVDDVFEVPLRFLMDPANHQRASRVWNERERFFYAMPFGERYIWGLTAGIIRSVYERLYR
ncbi:MAG: CoA pyrophosphatase [Rhizobiaceae bacterium]